MVAVDVVICLRAIDKAAKVVTDSVIKQCIHCGWDVWVSPESAENVKLGMYPDKYECLGCFEKRAFALKRDKDENR